MRDYSKYPVFAQEDIDEEFEKAKSLQSESYNMNAEDYDIETRITADVRARRAWQMVHAMIEANFDVINGKKSIEEANEATDEFLFNEEYIEKQVQGRLKLRTTKK